MMISIGRSHAKDKLTELFKRNRGKRKVGRKINIRRFLLISADVTALCFSCLVTYFLVGLSDWIHLEVIEVVPVIITHTVLSVVSMMLFGVYDNIWRYANSKDFISCIMGVTVGAIVSFVINTFVGTTMSSIYNIINYTMSVCIIVGIRIIYRYIYEVIKHKYTNTDDRARTMIVGAGTACKSILNEMQFTDCMYKPICIVDDDPQKFHRSVNGIRVLGNTSQIPNLAKEHHIKIILFAIPSCADEDRRRILKLCSETDCEIKIIPYLHEIITDASLLHQVKNIKIEDLLGRESVHFDDKEVEKYIKGQVCMITGGGGSIGSELCRQIAKYDPKQLIIVDIYENNAYDIQQELIRLYHDTLNLSVEIASVRDMNKMDSLIKEFHPNIIFHAAAHKHVPLMENNPEEAIKNNILGTFNVAVLADRYRVKKMVLISTDKAVNPTNVMGATKRCCEMIMQYMAQQETDTEYAVVRFGNVLGSNGSVIPLFRKQIEEGGPVTVTHPDIIRYFMTIPEAVSLVLQAGAMARGGEIFVLDMGEPVKITTLAENLIRLYGYEPYTEMKIEFTGLRPGEKLFEELLMDEEGLEATLNKKIFIGNQIHVDADLFIQKLITIKEAAQKNDKEMVVNCLYDLVPTFHHEKITEISKRHFDEAVLKFNKHHSNETSVHH